jgi:hypothetical protein
MYFSVTFMNPISIHAYTLCMIKKLFIAKTKDKSLFKAPRKKLKGSTFEMEF